MVDPCIYHFGGKQLSKEEFLSKVKEMDSDDLSKITPLMKNKIQGEFQSNHFDEKNILTHLRMNTRFDSEGNKTLFLEEIQSDWNAAGRKKGFAISDTERQKLDKRRLEIEDKGKSATPQEQAEWLDIVNNKLKSGTIPEAPFVTNTADYTKLALKVALREAVKQDAKKLSWTTGEQQNERYDLSKQVEKIIARRDDENNVSVDMVKDGHYVVAGKYSNKELSDAIGKELAEKVVNQPIKKEVSYEGLDLQVGGTGMKGFYGSPTEGKLGIIGGVAKSLFGQEPKKIGIETKDKFSGSEEEISNGQPMSKQEAKDFYYAKTGVSDGLMYAVKSNGSSRELRTLADINETSPYDRIVKVIPKKESFQHSIDITPELKKQVKEGLPLFGDRAKAFADKIREGKIGKDIAMVGVPFAKEVWNGALEVVAKAVELSGDLADAIKQGIDHIRSTDWYKGLTGEQQARAENRFAQEFEEEPEELNSWEAIRKSRQIEIDKVRREYEKSTTKHWTESLSNGLQNLQRDYPNDDLYGAAKKKMDALYFQMLDTGKPNIDDEDLAVLHYFKMETGRRMAALNSDINSNETAKKLAASAAYDVLKTDYEDAALAIQKGGSALGRSLSYLRAEMMYDEDNGLVLRQMDLARAKGSSLTHEEMEETEKLWDKEQAISKKEAEAREQGLRQDYEAEIKRLNDEWKEKLKNAKKGEPTVKEKREKLLSQKGKEFADKLRSGKLDGTFATIPGFPQAVNLVIEAVAQLVEKGATLAEAISHYVKEHAIKDEERFKNDFFSVVEQHQKRADALQKIKDLALNDDSGNVTQKMVASNLIRDYVNSHIGHVDEKDIFDVAYNKLKETLPNLTKDQMLQAYLKRGDYEQPTSDNLKSGVKTSENRLRSIGKLEQDIKDLKELKGVRDKVSSTPREQSDYEKELIAKKEKAAKLTQIESEKQMFLQQGESLKKAAKLTKKQLDAEIEEKQNELKRIMNDAGVKYANEDAYTKASFEQRAASHNDRLKTVQERIDRKLADEALEEEEKKELAELKDKIDKAQVSINKQSRLSQKDVLERGLKNLEEIYKKYKKDNDVRRAIGKTIYNFGIDKEESEQEIKLARTKRKYERDIVEFKRKLAANEFEDKPIVHLTKSDAELIKLDRERKYIQQLYDQEKTKYEKSQQKNSRRIADFTRSAIVTALIYKFGTLYKVGFSGVLRPNLEAGTRATGGKLFELLPFQTTKEITKRARMGGESSSWQSIKKGYEAFGRQYNAADLEKIYSKANDKFEAVDSEYQKQKALVDGMNKSEKGYKAANNKLSDLKNERDDALIGAVSNMIYQYIAGSSIREMKDVLLHRTANIDKMFGEFDTESFNKDEKWYSLDNLDYMLGFVGRTHAAAKNYSSRFSFAAGFAARLEYAVKEEGIDITDPNKIMELANESYLDWDRGKYQERNWLVDSWNAATTKVDSVFPQLAYLLRADVAITRVPANMIYEGIAEYTLGAFRGSYMAWREYVKAKNAVLNFDVSDADFEGFKNAFKERLKEIPPERAASIYRAFRKGGFGLGFYALALVAGVSFGGFSHKGQTAEDKKKKKIDDETGADLLKTSEIRIGNYKMPDWSSILLEHTPGFQSIFYGIGTRDIYESNILMGNTDAEAATEAIMGHVDHIISSVPILDKVAVPLAKDAYSMTAMSLGFDKFGQWTDIDQNGNPITRKPLEAKDYMKYITGRGGEELSDKYYRMAVNTEREYKSRIALVMNDPTLSKEDKEQQRTDLMKEKEESIDGIYEMNKDYPQ